MKLTLRILTAVVLALAVNTVYADDLPYMTGKDIGVQLYDEAFGMKEEALCVKDFGAPGLPSAAIDAREIGIFAYNDAIANQRPALVRNARGTAAGGVCPETFVRDDENTRIWDHLMGTPGGSDLP